MKNIYLGIDIGGTKIRGVLWDGRRVVAFSEFPTPRTLKAFKREILSLARDLSRRVKGGVSGVGIGVAGVISRTRVRLSPNIPYLKRVDFKRLFSSPLQLDNDARAFARAEWLHGARRGVKRILAITLGTGIGRAYGAHGKIARIKRFEYPEAWEERYQYVRDRESTRALAAFLGEKIAMIAKRYHADTLVLGGGVINRPGLFVRLTAELRRQGTTQPIRRARRGDAVAIGAAMLFQE